MCGPHVGREGEALDLFVSQHPFGIVIKQKHDLIVNVDLGESTREPYKIARPGEGVAITHINETERSP